MSLVHWSLTCLDTFTPKSSTSRLSGFMHISPGSSLGERLEVLQQERLIFLYVLMCMRGIRVQSERLFLILTLQSHEADSIKQHFYFWGHFQRQQRDIREFLHVLKWCVTHLSPLISVNEHAFGCFSRLPLLPQQALSLSLLSALILYKNCVKRGMQLNTYFVKDPIFKLGVCHR